MAPAQLFYAGLAIFILIKSVPIAETLSLKMVRRDSIDQTLFPTNLSDPERTRIFADLTFSRHVGPDTVRPRLLQFINSIFAVPFQIGSQNSGGYLVVDTGSDLTWVQCQGCDDCPQMAVERYDRTTSNSYVRIPWNSPDCDTGYASVGECAFQYQYVSGNINGIKGIETFEFQSREPPGFIDIVLPFGCTQHMGALSSLGASYGEGNQLAGILGLGLEHDSFMERTRGITKMKFSYCLPTWQRLAEHVEAELTFGDDVPRTPRVAQTTPMNQHRYELNCLGLSVGSTRLNIDPNVFRPRPNGRGGTRIDSGSGFSLLAHAAFESVKAAYIEQLGRYGLTNLTPDLHPSDQMELCYFDSFPRGPAARWMPSMTWHFEGADLEVNFWNVFQRFRKDAWSPVVVCMAILDAAAYHDEAPTLLGAAQQADYRFWYNLRRGTLRFIETECPGGR